MLRLIFWCVLGLVIQISIGSNFSRSTYFEQGSEDCRDDSPNKGTLFEKFHHAVSKIRDFLYYPVHWNIFRRRIRKLVYGGNKAKIEQYPHQVTLFYKNNFVCGGSIISDRYILTAAHCLDDTEPDPKKWKVGTGSSYLAEGGIIYCISGYLRHPRYNALNVDYDIAILETTKKIYLNGKTTKAVQLADPDRPLLPGENVVVTGYGSRTGFDESSIQLRAVRLPVVSHNYCNRAWLTAYGVGVTPRMFCAEYAAGGKSSCYRDSGGPVVSADSLVQYGIVSFGPEACNERGIPNVFTNIVEVRDWITKITGI